MKGLKRDEMRVEGDSRSAVEDSESWGFWNLQIWFFTAVLSALLNRQDFWFLLLTFFFFFWGRVTLRNIFSLIYTYLFSFWLIKIKLISFFIFRFIVLIMTEKWFLGMFLTIIIYFPLVCFIFVFMLE